MEEKKSLQQIADYYIRQGLSGEKLRQAFWADKEYQEILRERKAILQQKFDISSEEEHKYVLSTDQDYEILGKIHQLEKIELSDTDGELVAFVKTQLEDDWREPILDLLDKLIDKTK